MGGFKEVDISKWDYRDQEPAGKNSKDWYRDPMGNQLWLFKPVGSGPDVTPDGKDWAEKLAHELAVAFAIPTAPVEFARRGECVGTVCRNANPTLIPMRSGALLLQAANPAFDVKDHAARGHSLQAIASVLRGVRSPLGFVGPESMDAFGVFAGYLILDALVGNRDRHAQNWATVTDADRTPRLMASFDHGSSLGFSLLDARRTEVVNNEVMFQAFVNRGTAYRFEGGKHITLVDMAAQALSFAEIDAREYWRHQVLSASPQSLEDIIVGTRRMSDAAVEFSVKFVRETLRRLKDVVDT